MKAVFTMTTMIIAGLAPACGPSPLAPYAPYRSAEDKAVMDRRYVDFLSRWPSPYRSEMIPTSLGTTHVLINGPEDGPPVILLHGAMANALMWKDVVAALSATHRTIAVDIVGHFGMSVPARTGIGGDDLVAWIDELLDRLRIPKVTLIGTSFGGWLAMKYAIASNPRVDRMVLIAAAPVAPSFSLKFIFISMKMMTDASEKNIAELVTYMYGPNRKPEPLMVRFMADSLKRGKPVLPKPGGFKRNAFAGVKQPVLVLAGEYDRIFQYDKVEKYSKRNFANLTLVQIRDAGHFLFAEKPDEVNRHIAAFLGR